MSTDIIGINELETPFGLDRGVDQQTPKELKVKTLCGHIDTLKVSNTRKMVQIDIMEHQPFGGRIDIRLTKAQALILSDVLKKCYE
jgi:hypothetical protein